MGRQLSRRQLLSQAGGAALVTAAARRLPAAEVRPLTAMGIATTSYVAGSVRGDAPAGTRGRARDPYEFLEKCAALGAGGVQVPLYGDTAKLRARAEQLGVWLEGVAPLPRDGVMEPLDRMLADAKAAGATTVRVAMLSGRRYESFPTLDEWQSWVKTSHKVLQAALPVAEKHKITLAIENHKDWTLEDLLALLKTYSSEQLGVCVDFGNNISLLDDPVEVVEALAPYARACHIKDMGLQSYPEGFLMSEVPLGTGMLDLPGMVSTLRKANPKLRFSLEMMTRDPLKVPCLTEAYWRVFPERNGKYLARTLRLVQQHAAKQPLPNVSPLSREEMMRVEEENVKASLRYAIDRKLIA